MSSIKAFLLGVGTAYAVYYITRKKADGTTILEDLLENPTVYLKKAEEYAIGETVRTVKERLS